MTVITNSGISGIAGSNGAIAGADGTAGGAGGDALPAILNDAGNTNEITATGGAGGNGGNGADNPGGVGGAAGAGGAGGNATASTGVVQTGAVAASAKATATGGAGGAAGAPGNAGTAASGANAVGGTGGAASAAATVAGGAAATVTGTAVGGAGGAAPSTGDGGVGGTASTSVSAVSTTIANNLDTTAFAFATGGAGGAAANGNGGAGGAVTGASASAVEVGESSRIVNITGKGGAVIGHVDETPVITALVQATGGAGGTGTGIGHSGGTGGTVTGTSATATGFDAAASVTQTGGHGGLGLSGANGGNGGDSVLTNAVAGTADGLTLTLMQTSIGGAGGDSSGGVAGNGGAGIANLTYDETASAFQPLNGTMTTNNATSGAGGNALLPGGTGGNGGTATAASAVFGTNFANVSSTATGGAGGSAQGVGGIAGQGGDANAVASATQVPGPATGINGFLASATATGGAGGAGGLGAAAGLMGNANANASAIGPTSSAGATATGAHVTTHSAATTSNGVVESATAGASATGATTISSFSGASNNASSAGLATLPSSSSFSLASLTAAPGAGPFSFDVQQFGAINSVLGAPNPKATILAEGQLEGVVQGKTTGPETLTSTDTFTLNGSSLGGALVVGMLGTNFLSPAFFPATDSLEFTATVGGVTVLDETFTNAAAAASFFAAGNTVDLGAMPQVDGTQVSLSLTLTTDGAPGFTDFNDSFVLGTTGGGTPPAISGPVTAAALDSDAPVTVSALATASDANPAAVLSATNLPVLPAGVTFNAATQSFTLNPALYDSLSAGQVKNIVINYAVTDGTTMAPASAVFTVTGTNQAPFLTSSLGFSATALGAAIAFDPLSNIRDIDLLDVLTVVPGVLPTGVHQTATGGYIFDPNDPAFQTLGLGQTQTVVWNYGVSDGTVTVADSATFTVNGVEHAPVISGPVNAGAVLENAAPITVNLLANATDVVPGAVLNVNAAAAETFTVTSGVWTKPIAFSVVNNQLTIDPSQFASLAAGQTLGLTFNYQVTDGNPGGSVAATANIAIQGTYAGPTGVAITDAASVLAHAQAGSGINANSVLATFVETGGLAADTYSYTLGGAGAGNFVMSSAGGIGTLSTGTSGAPGAANGKLYALSVTANDTTAGLSAPATPLDVVVGLGNGSHAINLAALAPTSTSTPTFVYDLGGSDTINGAGMTGNLWLDGGQGADIMTGGSGVNDYLYSATANSTSKSMDIITNFHAATDVVDFTALGQKFGPVVALSASATTLAADSIGYQTVGGNTFIYVNTGGNSQTLANANMQIELQGPVALTSNNILHL